MLVLSESMINDQMLKKFILSDIFLCELFLPTRWSHHLYLKSSCAAYPQHRHSTITVVAGGEVEEKDKLWTSGGEWTLLDKTKAWPDPPGNDCWLWTCGLAMVYGADGDPCRNSRWCVYPCPDAGCGRGGTRKLESVSPFGCIRCGRPSLEQLLPDPEQLFQHGLKNPLPSCHHLPSSVPHWYR